MKGKKAAALAVILVLLIIAGVYLFNTKKNDSSDTASSTAATSASAIIDSKQWETYESNSYGWSIRHPKEMAGDKTYAYMALGTGNEIPGVAFTFPPSYASGTNLAKDSKISVETLTSSDCAASKFIDQPSETSSETLNGIAYSVAHGGNAGAGNFYDETVYAIKRNDRCYGIRLFIHSTNIGMYDPGTIKEFNKAALEAIYKEMINSFKAEQEMMGS